MEHALGPWMIILGILSSANLIIAYKPEAKKFIDKLTPYQGWFGFGSFCWGIINLLWSLTYLGDWPLGVTITVLSIISLMILLGAVLGVNVAKTLIKKKDVQKKIATIVAKIVPFQATLGFIAIFLGLWGVLYRFILL